MEEILDIYDEAGNCIGTAPRSACHGDPALLHHTSHVMVLHPAEPKVLLQLRKKDRRIQPGKWDTAVGGHLASGESFLDGAVRELNEELGLSAGPEDLQFLFDQNIRNEIESEVARVFALRSAGPFHYQAEEIDGVRFWDWQELFDPENQKKFTPNLCAELERLRSIDGIFRHHA